jgi:DNA-binding response OmpR family regulator
VTPDVLALFPSAAPFAALVVEPNEEDRVFITSTLTSVGFTVATADNFRDAKALLVANPPALLLTEIRLGPYNGLQLALRGRSAKPEMTIVLASGFPDPVLQRDVEQLGATFVLKPVTAQELIAAVYRTALRQPNPDGTFAPVRPPFERRQVNRRQRADSEFLEPERRVGERRRELPAKVWPT